MRIIVFLEALIIGIIALILGILISEIMKKTITFEKNSLLPMYIGIFILGASMHLIFEFLGLNSWWCRKTYTL